MVSNIYIIFFVFIEFFLFYRISRLFNKNSDAVFMVIVFLQLFFLAGFRNIDTYNDSRMYAEHFVNYASKSFFSIDFNDRFEIGYQMLEQLIYFNISKSPTALFLITSFIIQLSHIVFFYKYSRVFWFSVLLYIGFTHYFFSVSAIRQSMAIAIINFAFYFLINKKILQYVGLVILASLFHYSAFLLIFIPILSKIEFNKKTFFSFLIVLLLLFSFLEIVLSFYFDFFTRYSTYFFDANWTSKSRIGKFLIIATFSLVILVIFKVKNFETYTLSDKYLLVFYFLGIVFLVLSLKISVLSRYASYFLPATIVLLTNACSRIEKVKYRRMLYVFWSIFLAAQLVIILTFRPEWFNVLPYKFYWQ